MSKLERLYHLHHLLRARRTPISRQRLMEELGCSQATLYRAIADLRDVLGAPLEQTEETREYYYDRTLARPFELPGIWVSAGELEALLSAKEILGDVQPGLLETELQTLQQRITRLLADKGVDQPTQEQRVHIVRQGGREVGRALFRDVLAALAARRRLDIEYHARGTGESTRRVVSPQRLTRYRDNWYLDAWCHLRKGLRSFALERISVIENSEDTAKEIDAKELNAHYASAYGIFGGPARDQAILRFSAERARWVADEQWHPDQEGEWLSDGRYELRIPVGDPSELIMDVLRYGADVEVVAPASLRQRATDALETALAQYSDP